MHSLPPQNQNFGRQGTMMEAKEQIELFLSCRSLTNKDTFSKSDPYVIVYLKDKNGKYYEYDRTEKVQDNLNPNFQKSFKVDYIFEVQQYVRFDVYDFDSENSSDFIGTTESTISKIMGAKNQMCILDLKDKSNKYAGKLISRAEKVAYDNNILHLQVSCKKLPDTRWFGKSNPFLKISRSTENNLPILVYQSDPVMDTCDPLFPLFKLKSQKLCNGDYELPLIVEAWDHRSSGEHIYLGETKFSVNDLVVRNQKQFKFFDVKKKKNAGEINIKQSKIIENPSFIDFIRGGTQLNLVTAIDFTGSNGVPKYPDSLHALSNDRPNQYQQAIISCGEILLNYDHDKQVPVYGFGAKPRLPHLNSNQTLHCFPVNGYPSNPEVAGMQGILEVYTNILNYVELSGPTLFNPLIQETMKLAQASQGTDSYFILLILTDGEIHDMEATKSSIVASSHLPLSIIIIGIGNADFTNMEILDGDSGLYDSQGRQAKRDLVQFVPFNKFKQAPHLLAKHVLAELPDQLVEFKKLTNQKPNPPQFMNINDMNIQNMPQSQEQFTGNLAKGNFMQNLVQQGIDQQQQQQVQQYPQQQQYPTLENTNNQGFNSQQSLPQQQQFQQPPQFNSQFQQPGLQQQQFGGSLPPQQQQFNQEQYNQIQQQQFQQPPSIYNNNNNGQQQPQQPNFNYPQNNGNFNNNNSQQGQQY